MSALPPKADSSRTLRYFRFVPIPDYAPQQIRPIRHLVAAAEHRMRYHRIDRDRGFESRRQACRRLVERRFLGGEAEPSRAVSARLTVIARRTVTCCQTTNAGSC